MNCKNCGSALRTDYSFCPDCGAKVIRNRITFKNLWYDLVERFFNVDNTFLKTFFGLFSKPDVVIAGYIDGVRKKYMNPISYFTIAVTFGGLILIFLKDDMIELTSANQMAMGANANNPLLPKIQSWMEFFYEYQNVFYLLSIPILVLISKIVFWNKKKYNLSEHFVINLYAYSHISICVNALYVLSSFSSKAFLFLAQINIFGYIVFYAFMFKRLYKLNWQSLTLKILLFLFILGTLFVVMTIGLTVYMFTQPEIVEQFRAANEAKGS